MKLGFQQKHVDASPGQSLDGSFRRHKSGVSPDRGSSSSTASRFFPSSKRRFNGFKDYLRKLVDFELFSQHLENWILEETSTASERKQFSRSPFLIDELCKLDYALEGVLFQQLFRMPHSKYSIDNLKEDQFFALEDFLRSVVDGIWHTFWQKSGPLPFSILFPSHPGSKFYTLDKAISRGRVRGLTGAAVVANSDIDFQVQWSQVVEFALFKSDVSQGGDFGFSPTTISEALFYGIHILLARNLRKINSSTDEALYLLVLDSKFGGVIKLGGDLSKLDTNSHNPYQSIAQWIKLHCEVNISRIDRVWNKLGNANWGDLGTLQILLATFYSIVLQKGPPTNSIAALATNHSIRLQKRRIGSRLRNNENLPIPVQHTNYPKGERVEVDTKDKTFRKQALSLNLKKGDVLHLEECQGKNGFQIQRILGEGNGLSYSCVSLDRPEEALILYVGSHSSKLELSWENMSLWYQVQRQTKVLNTIKQRGISSKYLPEIIASGRILHSGLCKKQRFDDTCDHPWCGTPILVTSPLGDPLSSIMAVDGPFSCEEALRCCRDCLSALQSVSLANIQHGDICPENIIRAQVSGSAGNESIYVPISWGRAVLEDKDGPAINLQFSSIHALQQGKLCPSSDAESLVYLLYFVCGGVMQQQDSLESALLWKEKCWTKRLIQTQLGEVSALLKAFADYVDGLCGTPYPVDYDIWLNRLNRAVNGSDRGKMVEEVQTRLKLEDVTESYIKSVFGTT